MTDTLGGVQRHSSDTFWAEYRLVQTATYNMTMHPDEWLTLNERLEAYSIRFAPQFIYRKGVRSYALLVDERDMRQFEEYIRLDDVFVHSQHKVARPATNGDRMMYDRHGMCMGLIVGVGAKHSNQYKDFCVFDVRTGEYFEPKRTGFLAAQQRTGSYVHKVNAPSVGARYRDNA